MCARTRYFDFPIRPARPAFRVLTIPRQNSYLNNNPRPHTKLPPKFTSCRPYLTPSSIRMRHLHPRAMRALPNGHSKCALPLPDPVGLLLKAQARTAMPKDFQMTKLSVGGYQADGPMRPGQTFRGWWMLQERLCPFASRNFLRREPLHMYYQGLH